MADPLDDILKRVSRSFYLSIHVLPAAVRGPIAVGYLVARAADSIADTEVVPPGERLDLLRELGAAVRGSGPDLGALQLRVDGLLPPSAVNEDERRLLQRLSDCLRWLRRLDAGDRQLVQRVLGTLITGMERDLGRFPAPEGPAGVAPERVVALRTLADLDEYTYFAAGCVGEFWSELCAAHLPGLGAFRGPELLRRGVCLGEALQMVNVIRDAPADLRGGRCYWPEEVLGPAGLTARRLAELARPGAAATAAEREVVLAVTGRLIALARGLAAEAWPYVQALPPSAVRLRLSCSWPLLLCLDTLSLIERAGSPLLQPDRPLKVTRGSVRSLLLRSSLAALWDWGRRRGADGRLDSLHAAYAG